MQNQEQLDKSLDNFMKKTAKSTVAVIVPLYGYWNDVKTEQLDKTTLQLTLDRLTSDIHQLYILFVGDEKRIPNSVANIIISKAQGGNAIGIPIDSSATYVQYVAEGIRVAINETNARFFIVINPWIVLQQHSIDNLIERINIGDNAKVICGYDLRPVIDAKQFDSYDNPAPKEIQDVNFDFFGLERFTAEIATLDPNYQTRWYLEKDFWQTLFSKGYDIIVSQRIPFYSFDVDWTELEPNYNKKVDKEYFINKWHFDAND